MTEAQDAEVLVFLRTSEEAVSDVASTFSYQTPVATITGMQNEFDASLNAETFSISGTGFPDGDISGVSLFIDGREQQTVSVSATEATFRVIDTQSESSANVRVYFADGLPTGYESHTQASMSPRLVQISPSVGSSGGQLLTVTGSGFG